MKKNIRRRRRRRKAIIVDCFMIKSSYFTSPFLYLEPLYFHTRFRSAYVRSGISSSMFSSPYFYNQISVLADFHLHIVIFLSKSERDRFTRSSTQIGFISPCLQLHIFIIYSQLFSLRSQFSQVKLC